MSHLVTQNYEVLEMEDRVFEPIIRIQFLTSSGVHWGGEAALQIPSMA